MLTPNCTLTNFFTTAAATINDIYYNYKWNISVVKTLLISKQKCGIFYERIMMMDNFNKCSYKYLISLYNITLSHNLYQLLFWSLKTLFLTYSIR